MSDGKVVSVVLFVMHPQIFTDASFLAATLFGRCFPLLSDGGQQNKYKYYIYIYIYIYNFWMRKKEARVDNIILIINDTSGWDDHHRVDVDETGRLRPDGPHQSTQRPALNLDSKSVIFHGNIFRN